MDPKRNLRFYWVWNIRLLWFTTNFIKHSRFPIDKRKGYNNWALLNECAQKQDANPKWKTIQMVWLQTESVRQNLHILITTHHTLTLIHTQQQRANKPSPLSQLPPSKSIDPRPESASGHAQCMVKSNDHCPHSPVCIAAFGCWRTADAESELPGLN